MTGFAKLTKVEFTLLRRDLLSVLLPFLLPLGMLVGFGSATDMRVADPDLGGLSVFDVFIVPIALVLILPMLSLMVLPSTLASYRERGVLRRLATTPIHPISVLVAQLVIHVALLIASLGVTAVVAVTVFDVSAPQRPGTSLAVLGLGALALYGLGITVAALAPKANAATNLGMGLFFPQLLLGGLMVPADALPEVLARIGEFTPVGATMHALQAAWTGGEVAALHLGVLAVWTVGTIVVASTRFRWD
jgi:ABC-2 type transport system permease protein